MNQYIKMNNNDNHLSLGNFFRIIKENSNIKTNALQTEIFCVLFDLESINETTVNNYCTGYRSINDKYKQKYIHLKNKYQTNSLTLVETIKKLFMIIEGKIFTSNNNDFFLEEFNNSKIILNICKELFNIAKNDYTYNDKNELKTYLDKKELYSFICEILFFIILEKKQPTYEMESKNNTIEEFISNTYLSTNEIADILKLCLTDGIWSIRAIKELAKKENPIACFQLGTLEMKGIVTGKPRYNVAYKYFEIAANKNHPSSNWILGLLNLTYFENSKQNYKLAWDFFKKSEELGCIAAYNNIGVMYLNGLVPNEKKNKEKAIKYFKKAADKSYIFAYNNLGVIKEQEKDYKAAFEYFMKSATQGQSWAANKIGEYYRQGICCEPNLEEAFKYYKLSTEGHQGEITPWSYYNLAKHYYQNGCREIGLESNIEKAISLYKRSAKLGLKEAKEELLKINE